METEEASRRGTAPDGGKACAATRSVVRLTGWLAALALLVLLAFAAFGLYKHLTRTTSPPEPAVTPPPRPGVTKKETTTMPQGEPVPERQAPSPIPVANEPRQEAPSVRREGGRVWIEGVPHGQGNSNSYARGLAIILNHAGTPADYDTIMGDSGLAFITQAEEGGPIIDGAVDVGWWPLATWGLKLRLDFLGRVVGRQIRRIDGHEAEFRADPASHYRGRFELEVKGSIAAGRALLAEHEPCFVVAGYDDQTPPLLGDCALRDHSQTTRIESYPWGMIVLGELADKLDRKQADLEALRHAVALGRDAVKIDVPVLFPEWKATRGWFTGQKAFALWAAALRDTDHLGQARWHANMVLHLGINRRSAVACLTAMAARHQGKASDRLLAAAALYGQVLAELGAADTGGAAMKSKEGRERLAALVERVAALDAQAIAQLEEALAPGP